ncbi:hypothetical protein [Legionella waltersii]|uniref:Uncharacterized protein n=1 Tax=Legionella waltersii TaxID=66969 RepID=A0A0W0ZZV1_9GAMM|nr:hypothetical protein [Legionella waltersii]KTD74636.1 hypothetical protein Lwal_2677 [Legionella waltersii]SNV08933.1 Uncharacterised protein [Legionella waltersii]
MIQYEALSELLSSDLYQLRAENGHATLEAITQFVNRINVFFGPFKQRAHIDKVIPTPKEIDYINDQLKELFGKLSTVEKEYFAKKYKQDPAYAEFTEDQMREMIASHEISSLSTLRKRMQFWAATDSFGATIRNPKEHRAAVNALDNWERLFLSQAKNTFSFFDVHNETKLPAFNCENKLNLFN